MFEFSIFIAISMHRNRVKMKTHSNTEAINSHKHFQSQSVCVMRIHRQEPSLSSFGTHFCFHSSIRTSSCECALYESTWSSRVPVKPPTTPDSFIFSQFLFWCWNQKSFMFTCNITELETSSISKDFYAHISYIWPTVNYHDSLLRTDSEIVVGKAKTSQLSHKNKSAFDLICSPADDFVPSYYFAPESDAAALLIISKIHISQLSPLAPTKKKLLHTFRKHKK